MKNISRKGTILLLMSSLSFLLIVFLLGDYQLKSDYLGHKQIDLLDIESKSEDTLFYFDQMMRLSIAETWGKIYGRHSPQYDIKTYMFADRCRTLTDFNACMSDFEIEFKKSVLPKNFAEFNSLYNQNFKVEDFDIGIKPYTSKGLLEGLEIIGTTEKKIELDYEGIKYEVRPNFHIQRFTITEMDMLTGKSDEILVLQSKKKSLEIFKQLKEILKDCSDIVENQECMCDDSDIDPKGSSEGYYIKLVWVADKEYNLQLWEKNKDIPKFEETIKGRLIGIELVREEKILIDSANPEYELNFKEPYYVLHHPDHDKGYFVMYFTPKSLRGDNNPRECF